MSQPNQNPQIELLKWILEDIRKVTLAGVSHLTKEQLFTPPIEGEYPIGAYLMHLGECDLGWLSVLTSEEQPEELKKRVYYGAWFTVPEKDYNPPKQQLEPAEYTGAITEARKRVLDYIDSLTDSNLEEKINIEDKGKEYTITKKWIIYHLIEHEAHTRGQMFMLIRKAGWKKNG